MKSIKKKFSKTLNFNKHFPKKSQKTIKLNNINTSWELQQKFMKSEIIILSLVSFLHPPEWLFLRNKNHLKSLPLIPNINVQLWSLSESCLRSKEAEPNNEEMQYISNHAEFDNIELLQIMFEVG